MSGKSRNTRKNIERIVETIGSHHTGAYAAQAAYFFVLSLIPIIILLLTLVQFTSVPMEDVMGGGITGISRDLGGRADPFYRTGSLYTFRQYHSLYDHSGSVVYRKGRTLVTSGLNCIYDNTETRNYLYLCIRASFYTVIFILAMYHSFLSAFCFRKPYQSDDV